MSDFKDRAVVLGVLLALLGRDKFYHLAQSRSGIAGRIASAFCQGHAGRVGQNFAIYNQDKDKERITDIALKYYSDDSLHGFGDTELSRPDAKKPLVEQRRAMVLPLVEKCIRDGAKSVVEIGTGNGDVIAHLAENHPEIKFIGLDLSVTNAKKKHNLKNLEFRAGYPLDLLRHGLTSDVMFATSTFCIFAPKELIAYIKELNAFKTLIISDPIVAGNMHGRDPKPASSHMDLYMWWHNYFGYLTAANRKIDHFETVGYSYPHNPSAKFVMISATSLND